MGNRGVGIVERSTVGNIMTPKLANAFPLQKTNIVHFVVRKKKGSSKKIIAKVDIPVTVQNVGRPKKFVHPIYQTGETFVGSIPVFVPVLSCKSFLFFGSSKTFK